MSSSAAPVAAHSVAVTTAAANETLGDEDSFHLSAASGETPQFSLTPEAEPTLMVPPQSLNPDALDSQQVRRSNDSRISVATSPTRMPLKRKVTKEVLRSSNAVTVKSLKAIRSSFVAQMEAMRRLLVLRGHLAPGSSFLSLIYSFAKSEATTHLDLSGGMCEFASDEDFQLAINLLVRLEGLERVDVSGYCSVTQAQLLIQLVEENRTVTMVRCAHCEPPVPLALVRELAELCVVNEEYCVRSEKYAARQSKKAEKAAREEAFAQLVRTLAAEEAAARKVLMETQRKTQVKLSAAEYMSLVSAHRAEKRRIQEGEFEVMRQDFKERERATRAALMEAEANANFANTESELTLKTEVLLFQERASRTLVTNAQRQDKQRILRAELAKLQKHRDAIAALSMSEFASRKQLALWEAQCRAYATANARSMGEEAQMFANKRLALEEVDGRQRRLELDRLERERHAFREHVRHEDQRQVVERSRERERMLQKFIQSASALEREELQEFRQLRETRNILLQCVKAITAASAAEIAVAEYCADAVAPACSITGSVDHAYAYACRSSEAAERDPNAFSYPYAPLSCVDVAFSAEQHGDATSTLQGLVDRARALRRTAQRLMEESEMKLLLESADRALFCVNHQLAVQEALDPDCCPEVGRFLSQRRIVRSATVRVYLCREAQRGTGVDTVRCSEMDHLSATKMVEGYSWCLTHKEEDSFTLCCAEVTPSSVLTFDSTSHQRFCKSLTTMLNRVCFRRTLPRTAEPQNGEGDRELVVEAGHAEIALEVQIAVDGVSASSISRSTRKLNSTNPLQIASTTANVIKKIPLRVLPPFLEPARSTVLMQPNLALCPLFRGVRCPSVVSTSSPQSPVSPSKALTKKASKLGKKQMLDNSSFAANASMTSPPRPATPPRRYRDAVFTISLLGAERDLAQCSLLLAVEPGIVVTDKYGGGAGNITILGHRVTIGRTPSFFSAHDCQHHYSKFERSQGVDTVGVVPPACEECLNVLPLAHERSHQIQLQISDDGLTGKELAEFLSRAVAIVPVRGVVQLDPRLQIACRAELKDDRDVCAVLEVNVVAANTTSDPLLQDTPQRPPSSHEGGEDAQTAANKILFLSPDRTRPCTSHPGNDTALLAGTPNPEVGRSVRLFPRCAFLHFSALTLSMNDRPVGLSNKHSSVGERSGKREEEVEEDELGTLLPSDWLAVGFLQIALRRASTNSAAASNHSSPRCTLFLPSLANVHAKTSKKSPEVRLVSDPNNPGAFRLATTGTHGACPVETLLMHLRELSFCPLSYDPQPAEWIVHCEGHFEFYDAATWLSCHRPTSSVALDSGTSRPVTTESTQSAYTGAVSESMSFSQNNNNNSNNNAGEVTAMTLPACAVSEVELTLTVMEAPRPITSRKKRLLLNENTAPVGLGPYDANIDSRLVNCFNGGSLRLRISNGEGPEDYLSLREGGGPGVAHVGPLLVELVHVGRKGQPTVAPPFDDDSDDEGNGGKKKLGVGSTTGNASKSGGQGVEITSLPPTAPLNESATLVESTTMVAPAAAAQQVPSLAAVLPTKPAPPAAKSVLLSTPRRKGPPKPSRVDEMFLESSLRPNSLDLLSALSHRRGAIKYFQMPTQATTTWTAVTSGEVAPSETGAAAAAAPPQSNPLTLRFLKALGGPAALRGDSLRNILLLSIDASSAVSPATAELASMDGRPPTAGIPYSSQDGLPYQSSTPQERGVDEKSDHHLRSSSMTTLQQAAFLVRKHVQQQQDLLQSATYGRAQLPEGGRGSLALRRCRLLPHMTKTVLLYRRMLPTTPSPHGQQPLSNSSFATTPTTAAAFDDSLLMMGTAETEDDGGVEDSGVTSFSRRNHFHPALKFLGVAQLGRAQIDVTFAKPAPYRAPVTSDDVRTIVDQLLVASDPCTQLSSTTKLFDMTIRGPDGPSTDISLLATVLKSDNAPLLLLLRNRLVYEANTIEVLSIGCLPLFPYARTLVQAHHTTPFFDGGKLIVEIVDGAHDCDLLCFMTRDEQLKSKNLFDVWRQEQAFLRNRFEFPDSPIQEELLSNFVPFEGIGEVGASGRMVRSNVQSKQREDPAVGMVENFNPHRLVVEFGPFLPEHVTSMHVMLALNAIGFRINAPKPENFVPGVRTLKITLSLKPGLGGNPTPIQTVVTAQVVVNTPQLFIPEGANGRVFNVKRSLKMPLRCTPLFPNVVVSLTKFVEQRQVLREGYLEIRMVGPESGERLVWFERPVEQQQQQQQVQQQSAVGTPSTRASTVGIEGTLSHLPLLLPSLLAPTGEATQTPTTSNTADAVVSPRRRPTLVVDVYESSMYVFGTYFGRLTVCHPQHWKIDFDWSSTVSAEALTAVLKELQLMTNTAGGAGPGTPLTRKVEVLLCSGYHRGSGGVGCTSLLTSVVTLDAVAGGGDGTGAADEEL